MVKKLLFLVLFSALAYAGVEEKIKGMLIGKISSQIVWPKGHLQDEFRIGIFGKSSITKEIKKIYAKKKIKKKKVVIMPVGSVSELKKVDVLYIAKASSSQIKAIVAFAQKNGIVTISDAKGFTDKEGIVQLFTVSKKIKIKLNNTVAKGSDLKIKKILLKLAKDVK